MSQTWTDDVYASGHVAATDLANMEANFACLKSSFSGTTAPSNTVAGMPWFDTTKKLFKHRNNADSAWRGILAGSASLKLWLYLNAAEDGWAVDSSVTDRVLALKGGSTYTAGAATAGTWTLSGLTHSAHTHAGPSHNHQWYQNNATSASDQSFNSGGTGTAITAVSKGSGGARIGINALSTADGGFNSPGSAYTANAGTGVTGTPSNNTVSSDGTWRISAAVGTLQYPDV